MDVVNLSLSLSLSLCGTTTRSLFVLLFWPLSMRPRQHDRFVLIGLCWLYGRSEFPPPRPWSGGSNPASLSAQSDSNQLVQATQCRLKLTTAQAGMTCVPQTYTAALRSPSSLSLTPSNLQWCSLMLAGTVQTAVQLL